MNLIDRIKSNKDHEKIVSNFVSLSILQGLNLLLPLITFPFLVRVLGVEYFGLLSFSLALTTYFQIITDYGFNSTATRDISFALNDKPKQIEIFNDVMSAKLFLLLFCFISMIIIVFSFEIFRNHWEIYFFSFGSVLGQAIFPIWFFQGIQKMKYITYLNLGTKIFFTLMIFIFVRDKQYFFLVPIFNSLGFISAGIISFYYIYKDFEIKFKLQSIKRVKELLIKGKFVFLSELKISLFTNTNVLILGVFGGNQAVGFFTSAEKLARAIGNFQTPISNSLFPFFSEQMIVNKQMAIEKIKKIIFVGTISFSIIVTLCLIFSRQIILLIYGKEMLPSVILFQILLIIPVASFLDIVYGKLVLLNLGRDNLYFRVILWATVINVILNLGFTYFYKELGTAIVLAVTQIVIVVGMRFYAKKEFKNYD